MHVKTYTGKSTQALLTQIKEELGPDAIILSNRTLRRGGERVYEVTAGVDRTAVPAFMGAGGAGGGAARSTVKAAYAQTVRSAETRGSESIDLPYHAGEEKFISPSQKVKQMASQWIDDAHFANTGSAREIDDIPSRRAQERQEREQHRGRQPAPAQGSSHAPSGRASAPLELGTLYEGIGAQPTGWGEWHKEWQQIKDHLFALMKPSIQMEKLTPRHRVALEYLQREGVGDSIILRLYRRLLVAPSDSVLQSLSDIVPIMPWNEENWRQRIHCFTGPFGVGKTTTALRMALQLRTGHTPSRVAFINADCQRGNGRLILRHWAELSDFIYTEAHDALSMKKALIANAHMDKIFVDLPSLSGNATLQNQLDQLGLDGNSVGSKATHIVLSPSYGETEITHFLKRYTPDGPGSLVWAKLDEALSFGSIINAAALGQLPISALSCGAELRDTLTSASEPLLWRLIFKRQMPSPTQT